MVVENAYANNWKFEKNNVNNFNFYEFLNQIKTRNSNI